MNIHETWARERFEPLKASKEGINAWNYLLFLYLECRSYAGKASPHEVLLPENSMEPADYDWLTDARYEVPRRIVAQRRAPPQKEVAARTDPAGHFSESM